MEVTPRAGDHTLAVTDEKGGILDAVAFRVRGCDEGLP